MLSWLFVSCIEYAQNFVISNKIVLTSQLLRKLSRFGAKFAIHLLLIGQELSRDEVLIDPGRLSITNDPTYQNNVKFESPWTLFYMIFIESDIVSLTVFKIL